MPDLSRFAALAFKVGAVPVPPAANDGGTRAVTDNIKSFQYVVGSVPPVPPPNNDAPQHADLMDDYEERAAILEFDAHLPRAEAERRAWEEVFGSNATIWTPDPTRRVSEPLCEAEVDALLRRLV